MTKIFAEKDLQFLVDTVEAISVSPSVHEFIIGITKDPIRRRDKYLDAVELKYQHFVILDTMLEADEGLEIEDFLQQDHPYKQKYNEKRRNKKHRNSLGGAKSDEAVYSVYMSWK